MSIYPLKTILSTIANAKGEKRLIFNLGPIGGLNSASIVLLLLSLPFIEFAAVFNPFIFNKLGIATCIVIYVVFLSIVMMLVVLTIWLVKKSVVKKITPSWKNYFSEVDLNMVVSSGITPYSDFFKFYKKGLIHDLSEEQLHEYMLDSFKTMQDENKELLSAMKKDNKIH